MLTECLLYSRQEGLGFSCIIVCNPHSSPIEVYTIIIPILQIEKLTLREVKVAHPGARGRAAL